MSYNVGVGGCLPATTMNWAFGLRRLRLVALSSADKGGCGRHATSETGPSNRHDTYSSVEKKEKEKPEGESGVVP